MLHITLQLIFSILIIYINSADGLPVVPVITVAKPTTTKATTRTTTKISTTKKSTTTINPIDLQLHACELILHFYRQN
jgi:hypothetical protein